jgi:hypothetical protein
MELALVSGFGSKLLCFSNEPISHEIYTFFPKISPLFWGQENDKICQKRNHWLFGIDRVSNCFSVHDKEFVECLNFLNEN